MMDRKNPLFFMLKVTTLEDLHTGTGTGSGDIDALVMRDRRGHPVIRASHIKGLLLEAGEELITHGIISKQQLSVLLGQEGVSKGALRITSLRTAQLERPETRVWGATAREQGNRSPKPDTLHFVEHIAAGTSFQARLRLMDHTLQPLLERLLNRVDRVGGNRSRGGGLVQIEWTPCSATDQQDKRKPVDPISIGTQLRLVLCNLEPLCLPVTGHPGNLIRSQSFIRGQVLRGALMAWAIENGSFPTLEGVSVGDALPLPQGVNSADRVLPIPLSILTEKPRGDDKRLPWWFKGGSIQAFDDLKNLERGQTTATGEKPKRPGAHEYLCRTDNGPWWRYAPAMNVQLRNRTPKKSTSKDEPELFSMEEVSEETYFQADLLFDNEKNAQQFIAIFAPLLDGRDWLAIGREGRPVVIQSYISSKPGQQDHFSDDWVLTLISDLIIRGPNLGFIDDLTINHLCQLVGMSWQPEWKIKPMVETDVIHGFNTVSGMHRSPAIAIRRGSCWRITGAGTAQLAKKLANLDSLGERSREGYGRFAIDIQLIDQLDKVPKKSSEISSNRQEELLIAAQHLAADPGAKAPSLSQLQWLRNRALAATNEKRLEELLKEVKEAHKDRPQGGKAWQNFPSNNLENKLAQYTDLQEKRQLISYMVQWLVLPIKQEQQKENGRD
ncbi:MAG: hypothetical protein HQL58_11100 [Magnetococcales bacterium]|nr:hypothetical protein [Magnetococcales bacterium]